MKNKLAASYDVVIIVLGTSSSKNSENVKVKLMNWLTGIVQTTLPVSDTARHVPGGVYVFSN